MRWRAARVRIEHLLEPEHPEKEIKLGKTPELHDEPSRAGSSDKRTGSGNKDKTAPTDTAQARPAVGQTGAKPEKTSESTQDREERAVQADHDQKSDSEIVHHPTEATAELAEQQDAEPAAQLNSKETNKDQEAA